MLVNRRLDIIGSYIAFNSVKEYVARTGRGTVRGLEFFLPFGLLFIDDSWFIVNHEVVGRMNLLLFVPDSGRTERYVCCDYLSLESNVVSSPKHETIRLNVRRCHFLFTKLSSYSYLLLSIRNKSNVSSVCEICLIIVACLSYWRVV